MNPTITKLEKRVALLEKRLREITEVANDPSKVHTQALDRAIKKAEKALQ